MKLTINLATRRYINLRQVNAALALGLALLAMLAVFKVREIAHNEAELTRMKHLSAATGTRVGGVEISQAQLKALDARIRFANAAIDKKSVNWLILLDRLEEVVPSGVALTQIEPDQHQQLVKISGAARSFANLRGLLENMERSKNFSEVYLLSQSEAKVGLTQQGILFNVNCKVALR
jgi:type IV pilus assembly protein PilN